MMRLCVLLLSCALVASVTVKVLDAPGALERPGPAHPDEDGISVEEVVNVHKRAIVVVMSRADNAARRQTIRDTWVQPLNRTSQYAMPKEDRKSFSVWFAVPAVADAGLMESVRAEGKRNGDLLILESHSSDTADDITNTGAILRWMRVAYYQRFDMTLLTTDDSFVSLYNLLDFCKAHENKPFLYSGYVNSFAPTTEQSSIQKYYAPFVEEGTVVLGYQAAELIARELALMKHLNRFDASYGNFFMTFDTVKPEHDSRFIVNMKNVYAPIESPIVVKGVDLATMSQLSKSICDESGCRTPALPAASPELKSTYVYVDPHPVQPEPMCSGVNGVKCNIEVIAQE